MGADQSLERVNSLRERHRRFVEFYMGEAAGNATRAALLAGYSARTARKQGSRLLTKVDIQRAITHAAQNDPVVWSREERQRFWTAVARGAPGFEEVTLRDRLKASELLARSQGDFIERRQEGLGVNWEQVVSEAGRQLDQVDRAS